MQAVPAITGGRWRIIAAVAAVLVVLAGANVLLKSGPVGTGLVAGPLIAGLLLVLARRAGLSWDDLGLSRRRLRHGAGWAALAVAAVAAVYLVAMAFPGLRAVFLDVRYRLDADSALLKALLLIPLSTVVLEEVALLPVPASQPVRGGCDGRRDHGAAGPAPVRAAAAQRQPTRSRRRPLGRQRPGRAAGRPGLELVLARLSGL